MLSKLKITDDRLNNLISRVNDYLTPKRILWLTFCFLALHSIFSLCFNYQLYRDVAGVYAWYAREFGNGIWRDVPISKVPPLNIFLGGLLVRCGIEAYSGIISLSLLFLILTLFPLYKFLSLFCAPKAAAYGCLLWAFTPRILRFAGSGLLESTRDFFLVSAFYLLFKSWNTEQKWYHWCLMGGVLGGLILSRGEGGVMAGFIVLGLFFRSAADYKSVKAFCKNIALPVVITGIVSIAVISPSLVKNYKVTGYPVPDARMIGVIELVPVLNTFFTPVQVSAAETDTRLLPHKRTLQSSGNPHLHRLRRFFKNFARGAYELYLALALLGIVLLIKRHQWRREYTGLVLYVFIVSGLFIFFSVAHRYFVLAVPLFMIFTLAALEQIFNFAKKYNFCNVLLLIFSVIILLQPWNAWLWMVDRSDVDELNIKKYIAANRAKFLRGGPDRKLIIHADMPLVYRSGEERLFQYGEYIPETKYITGFDVLFVEKKKRQVVADCMARKDLRFVDSSLTRFMVFVPNKE